jgi:hypothetical protein
MLFSDVRTGGRPYGAFTSPADLALILHHELTHFEQYTTPGPRLEALRLWLNWPT